MRILLVHNGYPTNRNPHYCTWIKSMEKSLIKAGFETERMVLNVDSRNLKEKLQYYIEFYSELLTTDISDYDWVYIHSPNYSFPILFRTKNSRMAVHWHGSVMFPKNAIQRCLTFLAEILTKKAAIHIAPSNYFANIVRCRVQPANPIHISPSGGVDLSLFNGDKRKRKNRIRVGFASALNREKGFDQYISLIRMKAELESVLNCSLDFYAIDYGCDSSVSREEILTQAGLKLVQAMPKTDMPNYFNGIDIVVFCSKRKDESLGLVCLEAMACNAPVLASNVAAMPEYVLSQASGELFESDSIVDLREKFLFMAEHLDVYEPRIVAQKYSLDSVIEHYRTLFNRHLS